MPLTRDLIQGLAAGTVIAKAAQSAWTGDQFMEAMAFKQDGGSNGSNQNSTVSWNDYNEKADAQDRDFQTEYVQNNAIPDPKMITLREVGDNYGIDMMMAETVSNEDIDTYEADQVTNAAHTVKKGIARRFLFGSGMGKLIKGLSVWYDEFNATGQPITIDLSAAGELMTLEKARTLVVGFNQGRARMNVQPNTLFCSRNDLPLFESAQMLLGLSTQTLSFQDINYTQFGGIKIVALDFAEFEYIVAGPGGSEGSNFILARIDEQDGVYGVLPRKGKVLNVTLASEQKTGKRNLEGNVFTITNILPYNKKAFVKVKIKKQQFA
jgi:hypothetical protein